MEVSNNYIWKNEHKRSNNPLLPSSIRGLIIGKSNSGKTVVLLNLLLQEGWLDYNNIYIFGKSFHQKEYKILRKAFENGLTKQETSDLFQNQNKIKHLNKLQVGMTVAILCNVYSREYNGKYYHNIDGYHFTKQSDNDEINKTETIIFKNTETNIFKYELLNF